MNRKRIGVIMVVIGILLALAVGVIVYMQVEQAREIARRTPTTDAVVALTDLPERTAIPASAVAMVKIPADIVPVEAATKLQDVVGKFPLTRIYKSEVVINAKLADSSGKTGPAFTLKEGMVAVTFAGTESLTPTGAVRDGDRVDVLLTLPMAPPLTGGQPAPPIPMVSQTLLQNLEVMKVGSFPGAAAAGKSITFQMNHQDALTLKWAKDAGGVIDLVLRHPADKEPVSTEAVTARYVFERFKFKFADMPQ